MGPRGRGRKPRVGEAMTLPLAARLVSRGRNGAALEILRREARVKAPLSGSRSTSEEGTRRSVRRQVNMVVGQAKISLGVRDPFQEGVPTAGRAARTAGREIRSGLERLDGTSTAHQEEPVTGAQAPRAVTVLAATVLTVATVPMAISLPMAATVVMATSVPTAATGLMAISVPTATSVLTAATVPMAKSVPTAATGLMATSVPMAAIVLTAGPRIMDRTAGRTLLVHGCHPAGQTGKCRRTGAA